MSESLWKKTADGVKALLDAVFPSISATGIDSIPTASIIVQRRAVLYNSPPDPGILIVPVDEREQIATVSQNDTGHGIGIVFVQSSNRAKITELDQLFYWRELGKSTLLNKRIASSGVFRIDLEPRTVIDPAAYAGMWDMTQFVARCWIRST